MTSRVKVWIKAFIPDQLAGLAVTVPAGPHEGESAIRGPIWGVSDCFLTDNRGFSSDHAASARMHSEVDFLLDGEARMEQRHWCGPTVEVDCEDGDVECERTASTSRMTFTNFAVTAPGVYRVDLSGEASNPCFTGSPDIDYVGTITLDATNRRLRFAGSVDAFPAFEMYLSADDGEAREVFREVAGTTPAALAGEASRRIDTTIDF